MTSQEQEVSSRGREQTSTIKAKRYHSAVGFFGLLTLLTACGPAVDPPPLQLQECPTDDSPTELACFEHKPRTDFEPFDLGHTTTIHFRRAQAEHDLVNNGGDTPLPQKKTFGYRPGAARVER